MNEIQEMATYLEDAKRTIKQTHNLINLINEGSSDEDELKSEAVSNIRWAWQDIAKVKQYLNPDERVTKH